MCNRVSIWVLLTLGFAGAAHSASGSAVRSFMDVVPSAAVPSPQISYLDNGIISIGVDLNMGGCITYVADSKTKENVVNSHDTGREIQQSYFGGPQPFGAPHPAWANWPWNPIGCGDAYGNRAKTLDHMNDGKSIYVKTLPMQFALNNVPCECTFETWIQLVGNAARVKNRLNNHRADRTQYPATGQELPAVYT